ncbi:tetratricopeptide repeat protein, partial [bacterium]|nr:tetratricopeptide repeat protein [bacterium]
ANAGLPDQARTRCIRLLDRSPGHHNARRLLAHLHLWRGEYAAAAEQYQAMLQAPPTLRAAHRGLVAALAAQHKYKDAATEIQRLERLDATHEPDAAARVLLTLGRGDQSAALKKCEAALDMTPADPRLRRLAGMILMKEGKLPQALPHLYAAVMVEPSHFGGQSELATVAERLGIRSVLVATCTKLAQVKPDDIAVQIRLARALRLAGRLNDALSLLEKLKCESAPLRREVQAELALGYLAKGDRGRASKLARAVLDEEATHAIAAPVALAAYRASGQLTDAAQLCERMAAAGRGYAFTYSLGIIRLIQGRAEAAAGHLATATAEAKGKGSPPDPLPRAVALLGAGQRDVARAVAIEAAKHMPRAWQDRAALVVCLAATGAEKEAQEQLGEIELASADYASWVRAALPVFTSHPVWLRQYLVGVVAWRSGWLASAEALLAAARKSAPGDPVLLYASYLTARSARKHNEALALARQLVQVAPKAGLAHYAVGRAVVALGNTEAEAQAYATAMRLLGKQAPSVWDTMAKRLELIQRHGLAADAYRGLLAIQPESAPACNNLAWLYVRQMPDRLAEAETLATKAVKLAPASAAYLDTLGRIYYQRRNFDDAIRHLHKAIALDPAKASSYATLGLIYFEQKRPALARMAIEYALRRKPTLHDAESLHAILKVLRAQKDAPAKAK